MTTPLILSGKYQFHLQIEGLSLPINFTVPGMPSSPTSAGPVDPHSSTVTATETRFEETIVHNDTPDTDPIEVDRPSPLHVSAYLFYARTTGQHVRVEPRCYPPQHASAWKYDKVPVVLSTGGARMHTVGKSFLCPKHGRTGIINAARSLRHLYPCVLSSRRQPLRTQGPHYTTVGVGAARASRII